MGNIRIVHFMIFAIVGLTIFLYSLLYTASPDMTTIMHAGAAHRLIMSKDSSSLSSISSSSSSSSISNLNSRSNSLTIGDILASNNNNNNNGLNVMGETVPSDAVDQSAILASDYVADVQQQSVPNSLDNTVVSRIETRDGNTGIGTVVVHSDNIINTSAIASKASQNLQSQSSSLFVATAGVASQSPIIDAKNTANIADKSKQAINTTQVSSTTTTASAAAAAPLAPNAPQNATTKQNNESTVIVVKTGDIYQPGFTEASPDLCKNNGEHLRLLILITSAPAHHEQRLAIRQSWGHYSSRRDVAIGFILGQTDNQAQEDALAAEQYMYNDLVRGHFVDSYNNLTLKTISSLEWVDTYCPNASFFLKTDDDMFINIPRLLQFIEKHHNDKRTIYGRLAKKWKPIRNKKSKYYVSPQQYFPTIFPHFTTGPAYLMTNDVIGDLYKKSLNQTYLKLEDVYTTGIVAQLLNIKRVHVTEFLNRRIAFNQCNIKKAISLHMIKPIEQFDLWKKLLDNSVKCK